MSSDAARTFYTMKRILSQLLTGALALAAFAASAQPPGSPDAKGTAVDGARAEKAPAYTMTASGLLSDGQIVKHNPKVYVNKARPKANARNADGTYEMPYDYTFDVNFRNHGGWTVIDPTGGYTFRWSDGWGPNVYKGDNDWLVSPGMRLKGGRTYTISPNMYIYAGHAETNIRVLLMAGKGNTAAELTDTLGDYLGKGLKQGHFDPVYTYTPKEDGVYYFGYLHVYDYERVSHQGFHIDGGYEATGPDSPANLKEVFEGDALAGKITFDAPSRQRDGQDGTAPLTYVLKRGAKVMTGTAAYGAKGIEVLDTVPYPSAYTYSLYFVNDQGQSPTLMLDTRYLGWTYPVLASVKAEFTPDEKGVVISWPAVTTNSNAAAQGYCDYGAVTYSVKRLETGLTVAEGLAGTAFTDNIGDGTQETFRYEVSARYHNPDLNAQTSKTTAALTRGCCPAPYGTTLTADAASRLGWKTAYTDPTSLWNFNANGAYIQTPADSTTGYWLLTPNIRVKGSTKVRLTMTARATGEGKRLLVMAGTDNTPDAMVLPIDTLALGNTLQTFQTTVDMPVTANVAVGFRPVLGGTDNAQIFIKDVAVEYVSTEISDNPDDLNVPYYTAWSTQDDYGKWTAAGSHLAWGANGVTLTAGAEATDDWLVSPGIYLAAGKVYRASLGYDGAAGNAAFEIMAGRGTSASDLTIEAMPLQTLAVGKADKARGQLFTVIESGLYHLGIHAFDPSNTEAGTKATLKAFSLEYIPMEKALGRPTNVKFDTKGRDGTLSFEAPAATCDGTPVTSRMSIEIKRNGASHTSYHNVAPGQAFSLPEHSDDNAYVTYEVYALNGEGEGESACVTSYIGIDVPGSSDKVTLWDDDANPTTLFARWEPVTEDERGTHLTANDVTYNMVNSEGRALANYQGLKGCETTFSENPETSVMMQVGVQAVTAAGASSWATLSDVYSAGKPYQMPYLESFDGYDPNSIMAVTNSRFGIDFANKQGTMMPVDGDGGLMLVQNQYIDDGAVQLGKIAIPADAKLPVFSYFANNIREDNTNICGLQIKDGDKWVNLVDSVVMGADFGPDQSWRKISADLSDYRGKTVTLRLTVGIRKYTTAVIDRMLLDEGHRRDLSVLSATAPEYAWTSGTFDIALRMRNEGLDDVEGSQYKLRLTRDGEEMATLPGIDMPSGIERTVTFSQTALANEVGPHAYVCEIVYGDDEDTGNNTTDTVGMDIRASRWEALAVTGKEGDAPGVIDLQWEAPDMSAKAVDVVEGFEYADDFGKEIDDWTLVDLDGEKILGFGDFVIPGWVTNKDTGSYMVWPAWMVEALGLKAPDGGNVLATLSNYSGRANNDWAISPQLSGEAQTIRFKALSNSYYTPELIQCWYSTTTCDPDTFTLAMEQTKVAQEWTEYSFDVPEGAKYFAIQHLSKDKFWLMFDEFKYRGVNPLHGRTLDGYNVYRNGEVIDRASSNAYTDEGSCGRAEYAVTGVYSGQESRLSNTVTFTTLPAVTLQGDVVDKTVRLTWKAPLFKNGNEMPVEGYLVYRDGEALTAEPVVAVEYTDSELTLDQEHVYGVKAVYADGASAMSNEYSVSVSIVGDDAVVSGRRETGRYDALGRPVDTAAAGWVLIRYSDGTTATRLVK